MFACRPHTQHSPLPEDKSGHVKVKRSLLEKMQIITLPFPTFHPKSSSSNLIVASTVNESLASCLFFLIQEIIKSPSSCIVCVFQQKKMIFGVEKITFV